MRLQTTIPYQRHPGVVLVILSAAKDLRCCSFVCAELQHPTCVQQHPSTTFFRSFAALRMTGGALGAAFRRYFRMRALARDGLCAGVRHAERLQRACKLLITLEVAHVAGVSQHQKPRTNPPAICSDGPRSRNPACKPHAGQQHLFNCGTKNVISRLARLCFAQLPAWYNAAHRGVGRRARAYPTIISL